MNQKVKILGVLLAVLLFTGAPTPSSGFGMMKGNSGGSSAVAEILAAGLITGLLMDNRPRTAGRLSIPMLRAMVHPFMGGYRSMPSRHAMYPMVTPRYPMMGSYVFPTVRHPHFNIINHAFMTQAAKDNEALASRLAEEIKELETQESILEAALARTRQGAEQELNELLSEEESAIPAAALLLGTADLIDSSPALKNPHILPPPDMFETAASEPESRYLLPRIVRHFVQRLMRRTEHH